MIPEIAERIEQPGQTRADPFAMPEQCPVCSTAIIRDGAYHRCPAGLACEAQLVGHITHFASRDALDIDGLGEETARQLVERGLVRSWPISIHSPRMSSQQWKASVTPQRATWCRPSTAPASRRLQRFLYALGIRHIGGRMAAVLARTFGSLDALIETDREADREALERIPEIGPEIAASVIAFFENEDNLEVIEKMRTAGLEIEEAPAREPAQAQDDQTLSGKAFVFTGELEHYARREAQSAVEARGGRATSDVSSATDYVVIGDSPGRKAERAKDSASRHLTKPNSSGC